MRPKDVFILSFCASVMGGNMTLFMIAILKGHSLTRPVIGVTFGLLSVILYLYHMCHKQGQPVEVKPRREKVV